MYYTKNIHNMEEIMTIRDIVQHTDNFIRNKSRVVKAIDDKVIELLDDMKETCLKANGSGISAVQVGVLKRIFAISINGVYMEFINPEIIKTEGEQENIEGCLSVKMPYGYVKRPMRVTVSAVDRCGNPFTYTCSDYTAIAVCHEYDHLDGILYIDKITRYATREEMRGIEE